MEERDALFHLLHSSAALRLLVYGRALHSTKTTGKGRLCPHRFSRVTPSTLCIPHALPSTPTLSPRSSSCRGQCNAALVPSHRPCASPHPTSDSFPLFFFLARVLPPSYSSAGSAPVTSVDVALSTRIFKSGLILWPSPPDKLSGSDGASCLARALWRPRHGGPAELPDLTAPQRRLPRRRCGAASVYVCIPAQRGACGHWGFRLVRRARSPSRQASV